MRRARSNGNVSVISNQAGWPTDLGHHLIAGIDTKCAMNALQLRPIADIDPDGTDLNALIAIDTIAPLVPAF